MYHWCVHLCHVHLIVYNYFMLLHYSKCLFPFCFHGSYIVQVWIYSNAPSSVARSAESSMSLLIGQPGFEIWMPMLFMTLLLGCIVGISQCFIFSDHHEYKDVQQEHLKASFNAEEFKSSNTNFKSF